MGDLAVSRRSRSSAFSTPPSSVARLKKRSDAVYPVSDSSGNTRTWTACSWAMPKTRSISVTLPSGSASRTRGDAAPTRRNPNGAVLRLVMPPSGYTGARGRQAAVVDPRVVLEGDPAVPLMPVEQLGQRGQHGRAPRVAGGRRVGAGEEPSPQAGQVERL